MAKSPDAESEAAPQSAAHSALRTPQAVLLFVCVFIAALAVDLSIKSWAFNSFPDTPVNIAAVVAGHDAVPDSTMTIVPRILAIKLTLNQGAVFGMFQGQRWFFVLATIIAVAVVGYFFAATAPRQRFMHIALALILAGAIGNLYDRLIYAAVRDMFWLFPHVHLPFGWHWPHSPTADIYPWLFNAADAFLLIGIAMILLHSLFAGNSKPDTRNSNNTTPPRKAVG